jgi:hypothetical protein
MNETIMLYIVFIVAGILCGMMINVALDRKFYELGGITGGVVVGLLMAIL